MQIEPEVPKLMPQEEQEPYTVQNLPVSISIQDATVAILSNVMQISSDGFTFLLQKENQEWFTIYCAFNNTTSVGISGNSLMVFAGDQQISDQQQETPEILKLISASKPGGNVCLVGYSFSISIDFQKQGKNVLKQVHDIFVNYMGDADDERASRYDEDEDFSEMISANDIDQNGNIINKNQQENESDSQSEEKQDDQLNHATND